MKMIKKLTILFALIIALSSCGQEIVPTELLSRFDQILNNPSERTKYEISNETVFKFIAIPVEFGKNSFKEE